MADAVSPGSPSGANVAEKPATRDVRVRWLLAALFVIFALVPLYGELAGDRFVISFATRIMIFAIVALSLDLILGYGALVSFGHAAFIGIGAYTVGILASHGIWDITISLPLAILISALFAAITGAISLRTKGVYFIMITLAFGQMAFFTATSLSAYGGDDGLTIWGRSRVFGTRPLENDIVFYYVVFIALVAVFFLLRAIVRSRFGRVIRGAKENTARMESVGFDVFRYQLVAYVIAGSIAGLGGVLLANHAEFVSPAYMSWQRSGEFIIMVVLGGMGTLWGAILGAATFLLLEENLSHITQHWKMIFGPIIVLVALFAPKGLAGLIRRSKG